MYFRPFSDQFTIMIKKIGYLERPWVVNLVGCLFLMAMAGYLSILRGQDANWDLKNYHWYNAYAFLEGRLGFDIAPGQLQTFHNPLLDVPYYWLATSLSDYPAYPAFLEGSYYGLLVFFLIKCALLLIPASSESRPASLKLVEDREAITVQAQLPTRPLAILIAVSIGATGVAAVSQFGTTMNEVPVAALVMAGFYFMLTSIGAAAPSWRTILSGCLIGAAVGLKLTAATYGIGAVLALGVVGWQRWPMKWHVYYWLALLSGFLLFQGHWMLTLYAGFGNPMFPYYNDVFASDWWSQTPLKTTPFLPRDIWQWLFYPFYWVKVNHLVTEGAFRDPRVAVTFLALVVIAFKLKAVKVPAKDKDMWWALIIFVVASYTAWLATFSIYRYLIPVEALSGLALVGAFHWLQSRKIIVLSILSGLIVATTIYLDWGHVAFSRGVIAVEEVPKIPPNSVVMLMGPAPKAYVIPSFPQGVRFLGIGNNLIRPGMENRLQQQVDKVIRRQHPQELFLIESDADDNMKNNEYLKYYHLQRGDCVLLSTTLETDKLSFCKAYHQAQGGKPAGLVNRP